MLKSLPAFDAALLLTESGRAAGRVHQESAGHLVSGRRSANIGILMRSQPKSKFVANITSTHLAWRDTQGVSYPPPP
jgi:hypothetical protein